MICPNKSITFSESILSKTLPILTQLECGNYEIAEIYLATKNIYTEINEFILALDVLFIIGTIEIDNKSREVIYVKADNL